MKTAARKRTLVVGTGLIVLAGVVYGCKDFLEAPPQGTLDDLSLANLAGVEATLIGAYRILGGLGPPDLDAWGAAASNWPFGSVTSDDAYKGSDAADQAPVTDIELYHWGTGGAESYLNDKWRSVYEGVTRANATIRLLDRVLAERPNEIVEADANGIRGEAIFLRAHYHFEAWKMWGNVPYYTEDDTDFRKPNLGTDPVPLMLADLDEAIGLLPPSPRSGQKGRASQWTAKAYKGRVQVYSGDYAGGLTTLREVANSNVYALEPDYRRVWTAFRPGPDGPTGRETILAYQASVNDGNPNGDNGNWGERLNFPHGPVFGCCGFHQPSQNLLNFFEVDAAGLPLALSNPNWNARDTELDAAASANLPVDPRLDWTAGRDGVPYKDWPSNPAGASTAGYGIHASSWIRDPGFGGTYSAKKNVHEFNSNAQSNVGWNAQHINSMPIHLFRYADMLLLLAEAEVEAGSPANALAIVNEIRARAGVVAQGPGTSLANMAVPLNDPSTTWADYRIGLYPSFPSQAYAREAVRTERRLELAMEGHRFFDLRRWGIAEQVIGDYIAEEATRRPYLTGAEAFTSRHSLYPIPSIQIELSRVGTEDRLQQNPGW